jgi:hypothetical protein
VAEVLAARFVRLLGLIVPQVTFAEPVQAKE